MKGSRGKLYFHKLFHLAGLGLKDSGIHVDRIIREFLKIGEAVAARWIQMPHGILILQMVPGKADSGAIYLYDREQQMFYMVGFDGPDDHLTVEEFDRLMDEYGLLLFAEQPQYARSSTPSMPGTVRNSAVPAPARSAANEMARTRRCRVLPARSEARSYIRNGVAQTQQFHRSGSA